MSAVSLRASFHLHDCRNDRVRKNGLGSIAIATSFRDHLLTLERIVWCYSQWQPAYTQMLVAMPNIEFVKGIPTALNLIVFDDQMIDASKDKRIVNLFTCGSHHRNLSVIYIVQSRFHQGKGSRSNKSKQSLSGVIQESTRQIANPDSGEANVSRAD